MFFIQSDNAREDWLIVLIKWSDEDERQSKKLRAYEQKGEKGGKKWQNTLTCAEIQLEAVLSAKSASVLLLSNGSNLLLSYFLFYLSVILPFKKMLNFFCPYSFPD